MAKSKLNRDSKGDVKFDYKYDGERQVYWRGTYVFKHYSDKWKRFWPYFDLQDHNDKQLEKARSNKTFIEVSLYEKQEGQSQDEWIRYNNWLLGLQVNYFKEAFDIKAFENGFVPTNKFYRIILTKEKFKQISNFISEYKLEKIRDLILEVIAVGQDIYTDSVHHYDNRSYEKILNSIKGEIKTLKTIFDRFFDNAWMSDKTKKQGPEIQKLSFKYYDGVKTINDQMIISDILSEYKRHLEKDLPYKDWRKELDRFPSRYDYVREKLSFKYNFSLSLFNLLNDGKFFPGTAKIPNDLASCIVKILEFSCIPIGTSRTSESEKIKIIRNWINRKKLDEKITFLKVKPNIERLSKYFNKSFLDFGNDIKRADDLFLASYLAKRFDLESLMPDLAHIAQCIKQSDIFRGHQFSLMSQSKEKPVDEFKPLLTLYQSIQRKTKLGNLKFKVEGSDEEFELKDRLPLFIIEQALRNHLDNYFEDFNVDVIKSETIIEGNGKYKTIRQPEFNLPEERFMVTFVNSFYKYLRNVHPPSEHEWSPSTKYFTIIALMLQKAWFFNHLMDSEDILVTKVEAWYNMGQIKEPKTS